MPGAPIRLDPDRLTGVLTRLYAAHGCPPGEAATVARHLVMADLSGHPSHGSGLTPLYIEAIRQGGLVPGRRARRVPVAGDFLLFDGGGGFGQAVGLEVCAAVAAQVAARGVAVFGLRNVHHLGRLGEYGEGLARGGIVSATFTNVASRPMVAPFRGRTAVLGTNPVCIALPLPGGEPVLLDFATATIAVGKVRVALESGTEVAEGALLDADGRPTRDPAVMYPPPEGRQGALVAMGGYKGAGLNLVCELMAALIDGAIIAAGQDPGRIINSMVGMAFAGDTTAGAAAALAAAVRHYRAAPTQDGQPVLLPGEVEYRTRAELRRIGLPMPAPTWEAIAALAAAAGESGEALRAAERRG